MNLDKLLPPVSFTTAELYEIAKSLTQNAVVKYLKNEQANAFKAVANGLPKEDETAESYLRRQSFVLGQLAVFEALLGVEKPVEPGSAEA